jgi:DNA polymerase-3 subunit alpha
VAVKNVGESAIESIIACRKEQPFESFFDFCERVDLKKVNKRVVEGLIKCGAFDLTGAKRSQLMAAIESALEYGQRVQKERNDPQMGLFGSSGDNQPSINAPSLPEIGEWDEKQYLTFEKESLGFYLSGHPLRRYEELLDKFTNADAISIKELKDGGVVRIGGLIQSTKTINTKKGDLMAFVTIEDMHAAVEVIVFSRVFAHTRDLLVEDRPVLVQGQVQKDEQAVKILADEVIPIEKAEETWTASIHFKLEIDRTDRETLSNLHAILERHPGACPGFLHLQSPEKTDSIIALPDRLKLKAGSSLAREVHNFLGYQAVETRCRAVTSLAANNGVNRNGRNRRPPNGGFGR